MSQHTADGVAIIITVVIVITVATCIIITVTVSVDTEHSPVLENNLLHHKASSSYSITQIDAGMKEFSSSQHNLAHGNRRVQGNAPCGI